MKFHPELGPTPTVGVEIEVALWKPGTDMLQVSEEIEAAGFMPPDSYSQGRHDYHCPCLMCASIGKEILFPVTFKLQRDASLPTKGGEFISSPFPAEETFLTQAATVYHIISESALPPIPNKTLDQRGEHYAEVGLHVHAFSLGPHLAGMVDRQRRDNANLTEMASNAFLGFAPELFALAAANGDHSNRSLAFRLASSHRETAYATTDVNGLQLNTHHLFIASTPITRHNTTPHVEWRFWEMPYGDEAYFQGAIVISAALTQMLHRVDVVEKMWHLVALTPWDKYNPYDQYRLVEMFSERRFNLLKRIILEGTALAEEPELRVRAERLLNRVG